MRWITVGLLLGIFAGCASEPSTIRLSEGEWKLVELYNSQIDLPDSLLPTLEFASTRDQFTGYGGCNQLFGAVEITGNVWTFKEVGATKMACDRLVLEQDFIDALTKSNRYKQDADKLILLKDEQQLGVMKHFAQKDDE